MACSSWVFIFMKITIYSTATSSVAKQLKDYLDDRGISYEEKLIEQDEQARKEMMAVSGGFMGVPFVVFDKDGEKQTVVGFDQAKIDKLL